MKAGRAIAALCVCACLSCGAGEGGVSVLLRIEVKEKDDYTRAYAPDTTEGHNPFHAVTLTVTIANHGDATVFFEKTAFTNPGNYALRKRGVKGRGYSILCRASELPERSDLHGLAVGGEFVARLDLEKVENPRNDIRLFTWSYIEPGDYTLTFSLSLYHPDDTSLKFYPDETLASNSVSFTTAAPPAQGVAFLKATVENDAVPQPLRYDAMARLVYYDPAYARRAFRPFMMEGLSEEHGSVLEKRLLLMESLLMERVLFPRLRGTADTDG